MEKINIFDKLRILKENIKQKIGEIDDREFYFTCCRLSIWHYPHRRTKNMELSKEDAEIYEYMIRNNYNPSTVYKWLLVTTNSEEIQKKYANGEINIKEAMYRKTPFRKLTQTEVEFLYQIKLCIQKYIIR